LYPDLGIECPACVRTAGGGVGPGLDPVVRLLRSIRRRAVAIVRGQGYTSALLVLATDENESQTQTTIPPGLASQDGAEHRTGADALQPTLVPHLLEAILPLRYMDNARYLYTRHVGPHYRPHVHSNSVQKSTSSWWVGWKFLDSRGRDHLAVAKGGHGRSPLWL